MCASVCGRGRATVTGEAVVDEGASGIMCAALCRVALHGAERKTLGLKSPVICTNCDAKSE